jgi:hypothetical protein
VIKKFPRKVTQLGDIAKSDLNAKPPVPVMSCELAPLETIPDPVRKKKLEQFAAEALCFLGN